MTQRHTNVLRILLASFWVVSWACVLFIPFIRRNEEVLALLARAGASDFALSLCSFVFYYILGVVAGLLLRVAPATLGRSASHPNGIRRKTIILWCGGVLTLSTFVHPIFLLTPVYILGSTYYRQLDGV